MNTHEEPLRSFFEHARSALRPVEGSLELDGAGAPIEILTDPWGVAHVYAQSRPDLRFAQGYLHAAERLWQVDFMRRVALGRLAEIVGQPGLALDRFFRTLGLGRLAATWSKNLDDESAAIAAPYQRGFQQALRTLPKPVEYQILGIDPDFSEDLAVASGDIIAVALLMSFNLACNWPFELLRADLAARLGPERAAELTPFVGPEKPITVPSSPEFPGAARELREAAFSAGARRDLGSNNWVLAGSKTTTGAPILCNDPHLLVQMPAVWMEMHLSCPDMEVAGVTLPGIPGVVIGHNRRIAWGFTNTQADTDDLYLERLSEDGKRYLFKDRWLPVRRIRERITVRGEPKPVLHEVRETRHGPLITSTLVAGTTPSVAEGRITEALALRWIQRDIPAMPLSVQAINAASTWEEFREGTRGWPIAGQNMVYADVDGNIGYQFTGAVPIRASGSGAAPLPGWTGEHEWTGVIPFDELPSTFNPDRGFIATANHRVVGLDYPYYVTNDWEMGHRIRRITSLLTRRERFSHDDLAEIQMDTHSGIAADLLPLLLEAGVGGDREAEAMKYLRAWDMRLEAGSVGGAIFNAWFVRVAEALLADKLGPELWQDYFPRKGWTTNWCYDSVRSILEAPQAFWVGGDGADNVSERAALLGRALTDACRDLEERLGPEVSDWRWGRMHQVWFRHTLASALPLLDPLLSSGPFEAGGGDDTVNRGVIYPAEGFADGAISSTRLIIDLGDFDRSRSVITTGNSGNPASPYYRDQSEMWSRGEYHPALFSRPAVEASGARRLLVTPKG